MFAGTRAARHHPGLSPVPLLAGMVVVAVATLWLGVNLGIALSLEHGPEAACRSLNFSILDCDAAPAPTP
jgi:hypothetical protein